MKADPNDGHERHEGVCCCWFGRSDDMVVNGCRAILPYCNMAAVTDSRSQSVSMAPRTIPSNMTMDMIHDVLKAERTRYEGPARQGSCIQSKEAKRCRDGRGEDGRDLEGERRRRAKSTTTSSSSGPGSLGGTSELSSSRATVRWSENRPTPRRRSFDKN